MGLAPYGKPTYLEQMRDVVHLLADGRFKLNLRYFTHATQRIPHQWSNGTPTVGKHYSTSLSYLLGPERLSDDHLEQRHMDIAASVQAMYEEAFFHLLSSLHARHPIEQICLSGGCAANSVANGKITRSTPFKQVYVQAAAGDAGGALGAALHVWHQIGNPRINHMASAYLGPKSSSSEISFLLNSTNVKNDLSCSDCLVNKIGDDSIIDEESLLDQVCSALSDGLVVGWFQGRMEWGPRALGHRSILGDPRRSDMKDILNLKIKRRESFRPFAPSIYKNTPQNGLVSRPYDLNVPFMQVYPIRADKRNLIPAVTHVDGSGRLQTVNEADNDRYYRLIKRFLRILVCLYFLIPHLMK